MENGIQNLQEELDLKQTQIIENLSLINNLRAFICNK